MIDKREATESIDSYLGEKEKEVLKTLTPSVLKLFLSKRIKLGTSYYVRGNQTLLNQFKAFYLVNCLKEVTRPKYSVQMITDRAQLLSSDSSEELGADEVLFLYAHKNAKDIGKSEEWLAKTIISDIANRNRKGYVTIVLAERKLEGMKSCGEVVPITLKIVDKQVHEAVQSVKEGIDAVDSDKYKCC